MMLPNQANNPLIAIDGPSGAGKGSLARALAKHYRIPHLDTGLLYRAVAENMVATGGDPYDPVQAEAAARSLRVDGISNTDRLRAEDIGAVASVVATHAGVREALLHTQQNFAQSPNGAVLDGRDTTTVICPEAPYKFFVTAQAQVRAHRRMIELQQRGLRSEYSEVLEAVKARDARDGERTVSPLIRSADTELIDTSNLTAAEVFMRAITHIDKLRD